MKTRVLLIVVTFIIAGLVMSCGSQAPDTETDSDPVGVSDEIRAQTVPVEAAVVKEEIVEEILPLTAVLKPYHEVDLISEVSGKVVRVFCNPGDRVRTSDTLAVIDDRIPLSNYRQAEAQVLSAENNVRIAELNFSSDRQLFESGDISELALENSRLALKTAEAGYYSAKAALSLMLKGYEDTRIMSPVPGWVSRRFVDTGVMVNPGEPLFRVIDHSTLKADVGVPQESVHRIVVGTVADITLSALPGLDFSGEVKFISPQADEATGGFPVEIHVRNTPDRQIRSGMTAKLGLHLATRDAQVAIPEFALVSRNEREYVYRIESGMALLHPVETGSKIGSRVIVRSGVAPGDTIVVVGMKNLGVKTPVIIETMHSTE